MTAYFTSGAGASKDGPMRFERSLAFQTKKEAFTDVYESPLIRAKQKEEDKLNELGTGDMNQVKLQIEQMLTDPAMRKEFLHKVNKIRRKKEESKTHKKTISENINLVRNWIEYQHAQKAQNATVAE